MRAPKFATPIVAQALAAAKGQGHVPIPRLSRADDLSPGADRLALPFAHPSIAQRRGGEGDDQWRRLRRRLVWGARGARPISRGEAGLVRRRTCSRSPARCALACSSRLCAPRPDRRPRAPIGHPFVRGRFMFMANGQVGGWAKVRRAHGEPDPGRALCGAGRDHGFGSPVPAHPRAYRARRGAARRAMRRRPWRRRAPWMRKAGVKEALRFAAALTDGRDLYAVRFASRRQAAEPLSV